MFFPFFFATGHKKPAGIPTGFTKTMKIKTITILLECRDATS